MGQNLQNYGKRPERTRTRPRRKKAPENGSHLEDMVAEWLESAGIPFERQREIGKFHVDFFVPSAFGKGFVIEVNGCYYHECPLCGKKSFDPKSRIRDTKRYGILTGSGYDLLVLRECDLKMHPEASRRRLVKVARLMHSP